MGKMVSQSGSSFIVYDDSVLSHIDACFFEPSNWPDASLHQDPWSGRGSVLFVQHQNADWVIRHYYRGGFIGNWLHHRFFWVGAQASRPFREWALTQEMQMLGLPVPDCIAGRCERRGIFYTADLITRRLPNVEPFAGRFVRGESDASIWRAVGVCIAEFHNKGFMHADLNAHNLQIDTNDKLWLLDWDRGRRRKPGTWRQASIQRLQRSCRKICAKEQIEFNGRHWSALIAGYESVLR